MAKRDEKMRKFYDELFEQGIATDIDGRFAQIDFEKLCRYKNVDLGAKLNNAINGEEEEEI